MATPTSLPASFSAGAVLTAAQMNNLRGAFRILQVVDTTYSTETDSTADHTTWRDTGLSLAITPSATSSKIQIGATIFCFKSNGNASNAVGLRIVRGSTTLATYSFNFFTGTASEMYGQVAMQWIDSPSTTSATTYKIQFNNFVNAAYARVQAASQPSTLILSEISA